MKIYKWEVKRGERLLSFLRAHLGDLFPVKRMKRAVERGYCRVNGCIETFATHPLAMGDRVEFAPPPIEVRIESEIETMFEDEHLLVVAKPCGVVCEEEALPTLFPQQKRLFLVHRLDKETSGLWLLAKSSEAFEHLKRQFAERKVEKLYLAAVVGRKVVLPEKVSSLLAPAARYAGQTLYRSSKGERSSKEAVTYFRLLQQGKLGGVVLCRPVTGRTHQLRVQLAELGYPIAGDLLYTSFIRNGAQLWPPPTRLMLHAYLLRLTHPCTGECLVWRCPVSSQFEEELGGLGCSVSSLSLESEKGGDHL